MAKTGAKEKNKSSEKKISAKNTDTKKHKSDVSEENSSSSSEVASVVLEESKSSSAPSEVSSTSSESKTKSISKKKPSKKSAKVVSTDSDSESSVPSSSEVTSVILEESKSAPAPAEASSPSTESKTKGSSKKKTSKKSAKVVSTDPDSESSVSSSSEVTSVVLEESKSSPAPAEVPSPSSDSKTKGSSKKKTGKKSAKVVSTDSDTESSASSFLEATSVISEESKSAPAPAEVPSPSSESKIKSSSKKKTSEKTAKINTSESVETSPIDVVGAHKELPDDTDEKNILDTDKIELEKLEEKSSGASAEKNSRQDKKKKTKTERRKKSILRKTQATDHNYNRAYNSDDNSFLQPPLMPPQKPIPYVNLAKAEENQRRHAVKQEKKLEVVPINPERLLSAEERKDPFFQTFLRDVEKFVVKEMLIERGAKVLIGVSGGVDSVVLLDVLAILADKYSFSLYVAHYNHNLRGKASNEDEAFVKKLSASYNLPYYWASGKVQQYSEKNNLSIEEAARLLRYLFFERTARNINVDFLATAHTADDSAETFLLNLFRGSGLTGLSGIPASRQFIKDVILFRPFIGIKKKKIIEYAERRKLKWREDDTNLLDKYTRNKIRIDLLPKLQKDYHPSIVDVINRASKLIHSADKIIHDYVRTHIQTVLGDISTDKVSIKLPLFRTFDEFIRGEMLQTILMKYFKIQSPSMNIIDRVLRLGNSEVGAICEISKNIFAIRDRQLIIISRKMAPVKTNQKIEKIGKFSIGNLVFVLKETSIKEIEYNKNPNVEYFDFNLVPNILTIRNWESGDEFSPLGMKGNMKVSDFLSNEKVAILDKPNILVLTTSANEILWVCQKRINEKYKISEKTKRVLKIEIK